MSVSESVAPSLSVSEAPGPARPFIPIMRPRLPSAEEIAPWLRMIDGTRWYTNFGPLETLLRQKLGELAGLSVANSALFSSGTSALHLALETMVGDRPGLCIMPAWTHVGTAVAAVSAGLRPYLMDCDPATWALDPDAVERRARSLDVRAVVVVAPFGARIDYQAWEEFSRRSSIPVVIDGAAAFDQFVNFGSSIAWGRTPVMVSLHATKVFGVGEGGLLLSADPDMILRAQESSNFGIKDDRIIDGAIGNFKMSEYTAAVGLAAFDGWPERRAQLAELGAAMAAKLAEHGLRARPGFGRDFVSATCMISAPGRSVEELEASLAAAGIGTRRWWREGLHKIPQFGAQEQEDLPVTSQIAQSYIGVPFDPDMPSEVIDQVISAARRPSAAPEVGEPKWMR